MPHATITVTKTVNVPADRVWGVISAGDGLDQWLPVITQCRLEGVGAGATRYCTMANGAQLKERIVQVDQARRIFKYTIDEHPLPAQNLTGTVQVNDAGNGKSEVSWTADFDAEPAERAGLEEMLTGVYAQGIQGLEGFLLRG